MDFSGFSISVEKIIKRRSPPAPPSQNLEQRNVTIIEQDNVENPFSLSSTDLEMTGDEFFRFKRNIHSNLKANSLCNALNALNESKRHDVNKIDMSTNWKLSDSADQMKQQVDDVSTCVNDFLSFYDKLEMLTRHRKVLEGIAIVRVLLLRSKRAKVTKVFHHWFMLTIMLQFPVETIRHLSHTQDTDNDSMDSVSISGLRPGRSRRSMDDDIVQYDPASIHAFAQQTKRIKDNQALATSPSRYYEGCEFVYKHDSAKYQWRSRKPTKFGSQLEQMKVDHRKRLLELEINLLRTSINDVVTEEQYDKAIALESEALSLLRTDNDAESSDRFVNIMYRISEIRSMSEVIDAARDKRLLTGWVYPVDGRKKKKKRNSEKVRLALTFK